MLTSFPFQIGKVRARARGKTAGRKFWSTTWHSGEIENESEGLLRPPPPKLGERSLLRDRVAQILPRGRVASD